ncbi:isocitrate dehydrogenase [Massilia sp. WF1]|uniref:bifunctional isocitrate dehydrogenase kinase/phosphatase n=1 Tax=unclassified Massilia TaxID=2609279 RepID=UPI00064A9CD7|nr:MULTISPECIES: bifunctional isocitrate dehydrogenase kinase/phosphatase [unclassified Massilia]ALK95010.1 bifunctional isocitrate dehydrogenase kinase/phosphatase [Massilia sp. WG5]KLU38428.1 isocitrate dehydrogenase [Massilia sp. WF1]
MTQASFPKLLSSQIAFDIARTILDGFDRHYSLFRQASQAAKTYFEQADWSTAQRAARERIDFYDRRVQECVQSLEDEYAPEEFNDGTWRETKLHYIGLLTGHKRPELAESFFNSVSCHILHRTYYRNDFLFVRPAVSTEYIETEEPQPTYRVYYPAKDGLRFALRRVVTNFQLARPFADLDRDIALVERRLVEQFGLDRAEANQQLQVLSSLFFRNKGAYIVGRAINGVREYPFVIPVLHERGGALVLDTVLTEPLQVLTLFSFTRAYFMVDMEVPSSYVQFLRSLMPMKPRSEIYTVLGLQKQGKTLFYRDFLQHLKHSSDEFRIAPGIPGLVMLVFELPSFPYVFKAIKDFYPPPKETTRAQVKEKYLLVKHHDRVGRMADTLEYSDVAFPLARFPETLLDELRRHAPSLLELEGDRVIVKHLYIERRMVPLNLYLLDAERSGDSARLEHGVIEYGNAIRDLVAANIFPGDMLYKNFGVTRHGRVVFYDYDEIEYLTDCNFRDIPQARNEEDEMAAEPWYPIGRHDVFPEQFERFLLGNPNIRTVFMQHHAELLTRAWWQSHKERIQAGIVEDVFPYPQQIRFSQPLETLQ